MTVQTTIPAPWETAHAAFASARAADASPEWVRALRARGLDRFRATGFPGKKDEEWRFTDVKALAGGEFTVAAPAAPSLYPSSLAPTAAVRAVPIGLGPSARIIST